MTSITDGYTVKYLRTNGVLLHTIFAGPEDGEPIVLLHGFPDFWYGWRRQIKALAEQGFRVIVPDQRGYNLSDKPDRISDYRISTLATDVAGLADTLGYEQINLVGHDWGGAVAWWVATMFPQRLKKLIILNTPYPSIMLKEFKKFNPRQIRKSWYMGFFQFPFLPELGSAMGNYAPMVNKMLASSRPGTFSEADLEYYRQAWSQPNALRSMINWYRAMTRGGSSRPARHSDTTSAREEKPASDEARPARRRITTPTLLLWGDKDDFFSAEMAQPSVDICEQGRLIAFPEGTHWLKDEESEDVNRLIAQFVREGRVIHPAPAGD